MSAILETLSTETEVDDNLRELDRRTNNGLDVTLRWNKLTKQVSVQVIDTKVGSQFEFSVEDANASDAFYHPFVYVGEVESHANGVSTELDAA